MRPLIRHGSLFSILKQTIDHRMICFSFQNQKNGSDFRKFLYYIYTIPGGLPRARIPENVNNTEQWNRTELWSTDLPFKHKFASSCFRQPCDSRLDSLKHAVSDAKHRSIHPILSIESAPRTALPFFKRRTAPFISDCKVREEPQMGKRASRSPQRTAENIVFSIGTARLMQQAPDSRWNKKHSCLKAKAPAFCIHRKMIQVHIGNYWIHKTGVFLVGQIYGQLAIKNDFMEPSHKKTAKIIFSSLNHKKNLMVNG